MQMRVVTACELVSKRAFHAATVRHSFFAQPRSILALSELSWQTLRQRTVQLSSNCLLLRVKDKQIDIRFDSNRGVAHAGSRGRQASNTVAMKFDLIESVISTEA